MPASVSRSMRSSGATLTVAMLVTSGRFIGAATARTLSSRIFIIRSFPLEARLAFFHEGAPPFLVVLAARAALDRRAHARRVRRAGGFHVFLEDGLRVGDRQRRVLAKGLQGLFDVAFQVGIGENAVHQADRQR